MSIKKPLSVRLAPLATGNVIAKVGACVLRQIALELRTKPLGGRIVNAMAGIAICSSTICKQINGCSIKKQVKANT